VCSALQVEHFLPVAVFVIRKTFVPHNCGALLSAGVISFSVLDPRVEHFPFIDVLCRKSAPDKLVRLSLLRTNKTDDIAREFIFERFS
jgi:hypothetical protein